MEIDLDDFLSGKHVFENVVCHSSHCSVGNILWVKTMLKQPTITISNLKCPLYFCSLIYGYLTFPNLSSTAAVSSYEIVRLVENTNTSRTRNLGCPVLQQMPPCLSPSTFTENMARNALQCFCKLKHRLQIITGSSMKKIENVQWRWRSLNSRRRLWRRRNVLIESIVDCIVLN